MAEIKSSLELALARAAALGGDDDDGLRLEGRRKGESLARRLLAGDLAPAELVRELKAMPASGREAAEREAVKAALEALPTEEAERGEKSLALLEELIPADKAERLSRTLAAYQKGRLAVLKEAEAALAEDLAARGIKGSAISPNPAAHPGLEELGRERLAPLLAELEAAKAEILRAGD